MKTEPETIIAMHLHIQIEKRWNF